MARAFGLLRLELRPAHADARRRRGESSLSRAAARASAAAQLLAQRGAALEGVADARSFGLELLLLGARCRDHVLQVAYLLLERGEGRQLVAVGRDLCLETLVALEVDRITRDDLADGGRRDHQREGADYSRQHREEGKERDARAGPPSRPRHR